MAKTVNAKATVNPVEPTPTPLTIENIIAAIMATSPIDELIAEVPGRSPACRQRNPRHGSGIHGPPRHLT